MSTQSINGESFGSNLLMGAVIAASALLLYTSLATSQVQPAAQPVTLTAAPPAIEQVVVIAPRHVS